MNSNCIDARKFPLCRMSGACVSVNHRSTSSFRPPSDVSICRSTPDFFSILTRFVRSWQSTGTPCVLSAPITFISQKEGKVTHLTISVGRLFHLKSGIVSVYLPVTPLPLTDCFILLSVFLVPDSVWTVWSHTVVCLFTPWFDILVTWLCKKWRNWCGE